MEDILEEEEVSGVILVLTSCSDSVLVVCDFRCRCFVLFF